MCVYLEGLFFFLKETVMLILDIKPLNWRINLTLISGKQFYNQVIWKKNQKNLKYLENALSSRISHLDKTMTAYLI